MSVVYRGRDTALDREVAVKVLHPHLASRPESRQRFSREARAVARLSHPAIVEIYDYSGDAAEESWLVTEFVHGRTLRALVEAVGVPLPECGALVGLALADALAHAHAAGVIHRDLKPENVLISEQDGRRSVKLADFGIARILSQDDRMTMTGAMVGSPNHMAPEVVDGREADERSDVFSLGTLLYWLCTGALPFDAPNPTATLRRLVQGDFPDPRSVQPALSEPLARIVRDCLALDPTARPASAAEVRDRIASALREDGVAPPEEWLAAYLSDPAATAAALRPRIVAARVARGEAHLAAGRTALALQDFDGVLALDPANAAVLARLDALARRDRLRRALRRTGLAVAGAALAALLVVGVVRLRDGSPPPGATGAAAGFAPSTASPSTASPPGGPVRAPPPAPAPVAAPATGSEVPPASVQTRIAPDAGRATPVAPAGRREAAPVSLTVHVRPYAQRALLDGEEVAAGQQRIVFALSPGPHRIRIEHPCCEPFEREIDAADAARLPELKAPLRPRPATLRVVGDPATLVLLDGRLLGTAGDSQREPFRVSVPSDGPNPYEGEGELRLEPPGQRAASAPVRIRAGQEIVVPVVEDAGGQR